jgi:hypothetical protein
MRTSWSFGCWIEGDLLCNHRLSDRLTVGSMSLINSLFFCLFFLSQLSDHLVLRRGDFSCSGIGGRVSGGCTAALGNYTHSLSVCVSDCRWRGCLGQRKYNRLPIIRIDWEIFSPYNLTSDNPQKKNETKTRKCKRYISLFTDSSRTDDNYSYSIEKLL